MLHPTHHGQNFNTTEDPIIVVPKTRQTQTESKIASMNQLQPFNPPIGCTQYVNPNQETRLILKEKVMSITGDAFDIKLDPQNGQPPQPVFKVDPSWITTKKAFYDMAGNHLFDMKKEWMHLVHRTFKIVDPQGVKFFEVKSGFTCESILLRRVQPSEP